MSDLPPRHPCVITDDLGEHQFLAQRIETVIRECWYETVGHLNTSDGRGREVPELVIEIWPRPDEGHLGAQRVARAHKVLRGAGE